MAKVSGSKGSVRGPSTPSAQPTAPAAATPSAPTAAAHDGISEAAKGLLGYKSSRLVSGALKIFGDSVVLPANLTDPKDPRNDVKYLRLVSAVLGLDELERHFYTMDEKKQKEYLEYKAKQREEKWAKKEEEKEEKRRRREEESH